MDLDCGPECFLFARGAEGKICGGQRIQRCLGMLKKLSINTRTEIQHIIFGETLAVDILTWNKNKVWCE